jgi:nifR3 family TIM-barrel protein
MAGSGAEPAIMESVTPPAGSRVAPLRIGPIELATPVVLAPMAGVTNAPFRTLCRRFHPGGLYVNEMVMARAVVEGNRRTDRMLTFAPDENPRSIQLYAVEPRFAALAARRLVEEYGVGHLDMNFGCPAAKVTRNGGGAAVPAKPALLARIVRAVVEAAGPVPVTMKFRMGIDDSITTFRDAGRIGEAEGCAAVALHARTAEEHYSGRAHWDAIGELKSLVTSIPVLGNGDIWEATDALAMMRSTGCDGVVVGRGCLGRPWLFGQLAAVMAGEAPMAPPPFGFVGAVMAEHAERLGDLFGLDKGVREFRKHTGWYLTGYPVGGEIRGRFANASSLAELQALIDSIDPALAPLPGAEAMTRGHTGGPRPARLPAAFLDDDYEPTEDAELVVSGG